MRRIFCKGKCDLKSAVIISNGAINDISYTKKYISREDFVICADGAAHHLMKMGIFPDVWIGDYDSCTMTRSEFSQFSKESEIIRLNPVKDATDTEEACDYVIKRGFDSVTLLGSIGTRMDHSLANIYLLKKFADANIEARIVNENNIIRLAKAENIISKTHDFTYLSLIPLSGGLHDVCISGMKYTLNHADVSQFSSIGVSNEITEDEGRITIGQGDALIILSKD